MTLWKKTLLGIAVSLGLLSVSLYVIQRYLVLTSYTALEQRYARGDAERAVRALEAELHSMDGVALGSLAPGLPQQVSALVGRPVEVRQVDDPGLPADWIQAREALSTGDGSYASPLDDAYMAGYGLIRDATGNPALIVRTLLPRDIYAYGQISFRYLAAAIALVGVLFWGVIVLLIERAVLARIGLLGREVSRVGGAGDLSQRVLLRGQDEVGRLADQVNAMLTDLQQAKESIRWRERYLEGLAGAAQSLLAPSAEIHYAEFLRPLGEATHASRAGVFLNGRGMAGELVTSLKGEWCAPGTASLLGNPKLQNLALVASGLERAAEDLQAGLPVQGVTSELLPRERVFLEGLGVQAIAVLPLLVDGAFLGLLAFQQCQTSRPRLENGETQTPRRWDAAEVDLMRAAAVDLVQALQAKRKDKVQGATYRVSQAALAVERLDEFFRAVWGIVRELMPTRGFYIAVRDRASGALAFRFVADGDQELAEPEGLGKELAEYVVRSGESLLVPVDVFEKMRSQQATPSISAGDWLGVPLKVQERVIGVLAVHSLIQGGRLGAEELDVLNFVSGQVAMAVDRRQAEQEREGLQARLGEVHGVGAPASQQDGERITR